MSTIIGQDVEQAKESNGSPGRVYSTARGISDWILEQLAAPDRQEPSRAYRIRLATICAAVFVAALGVRALHWQDSYSELAIKGPWMPGIATTYKVEAARMLDQGAWLYPTTSVDPGDARLILHPPGYPTYIARVFAFWRDSDLALRLIQIILDSISAVMVLLIAAQLLNLTVATIAATLVAFSPHLSHYSLWISPDTLCVLPILIAVYLLIVASKKPRLITFAAAGAMIGVSCWLRANALLLTFFLGVVVWLLVERGKWLRYGAAMIAATLLVISPITIRNWILFHKFVPLSIAGGENLVIGIADFDKEGRFGMPTSDGDAAVKDAEWHDRKDYLDSAWRPDGIERDQFRYKRGLEVIRSNPSWFIRVMIKRAIFMLEYNNSVPGDWPFSTSTVSVLCAYPLAIRSPGVIDGMEPQWSASAANLLAEGSVLSGDAKVSLEDGDQLLDRKSVV